jgi:hypothetical protein
MYVHSDNLIFAGCDNRLLLDISFMGAQQIDLRTNNNFTPDRMTAGDDSVIMPSRPADSISFMSNSILSLGIMLGAAPSSGLGLGPAIELRPLRFVSAEIIPGFDIFHMVNSLQARLKVYPITGTDVFCGAGYFHSPGYGDSGHNKIASSWFQEIYGHEYFAGWKTPFIITVEMGWRESYGPWEIYAINYDMNNLSQTKLATWYGLLTFTFLSF